jgi:long-chain acyl-CoA synthetase
MASAILQSLIQSKSQRNRATGVQFKVQNTWLNYTWAEVYELVEQIAAGLISHDVLPGQKIAIFSRSRAEWFFADLAILAVHGLTVPLDLQSTHEELRTILRDTRPELIFVDDAVHARKILQLKNTELKRVVLFQSQIEDPLAMSFEEILTVGRQRRRKYPQEIRNRIETIAETDFATQVYTPGTLGDPKSIILTHQQINSALRALRETLHVSPSDKLLSLVPPAKILSRIEWWLALTAQCTLGFAENRDPLTRTLSELKPTLLFADAPLLEKLCHDLRASLTGPVAPWLLSWSLYRGQSTLRDQQRGRPLSPFQALETLVAQNLVIKQLHQRLGGKLRALVCGGSSLPSSIVQFFFTTGVPVLEGYGLTETAGLVTINTPHAFALGTLGKPLPGVELSLAEDGEILIRGPQVRNDSSSDGFFRTGDLGEWTASGYLQFRGRKSDIIHVMRSGLLAKISPEKIEDLFHEHPLIDYALVEGESSVGLFALITLHPDRLFKFAKALQLSYQDYTALVEFEAVQTHVMNVVRAINAKLSPAEQIRAFRILPNTFSIESGELNSAMKLRRLFCRNKYRNWLEKLAFEAKMAPVK